MQNVSGMQNSLTIERQQLLDDALGRHQDVDHNLIDQGTQPPHPSQSLQDQEFANVLQTREDRPNAALEDGPSALQDLLSDAERTLNVIDDRSLGISELPASQRLGSTHQTAMSKAEYEKKLALFRPPKIYPMEEGTTKLMPMSDAPLPSHPSFKSALSDLKPKKGSDDSLGKPNRVHAAVAFVILVLVVWRAVDDYTDSLMKMDETLAYDLLDIALPCVLIVLGLGISFSLANWIPKPVICILIATYGGLTGAAYALDALLQWIIGCCAGAVYPCFLIVQVLSSRPHEGGRYNYGTYTFIAPTFNGILNVAAFKVAEEMQWSSVTRWKLASFGGPVIVSTFGKLVGAYKFTTSQFLLYFIGQLSMYIFVYNGVCQWLERGTVEILTPTFPEPPQHPTTAIGALCLCGFQCASDTVQCKAPEPICPTPPPCPTCPTSPPCLLFANLSTNSTNDTTTTVTSSLSILLEDVSTWPGSDGWEQPLAWAITGVVVIFYVILRGITLPIMQELFCWKACVAKWMRLNNGRQPRRAGFLQWAFWSLGILIGGTLIAGSLPELFVGTWDSQPGLAVIALIKVLLGLGLLHDKTLRMRGRCLAGNADYIYRGRGRPMLTDADWRAKKVICTICCTSVSCVFVPVWFLAASFDRPQELIILDGIAVWSLFLFSCLRIILVLGGCNYLHYVVREEKPANEHDEWNYDMKPSGWLEPFVHLVANPHQHLNASGLDQRLMARVLARSHRKDLMKPPWIKDREISDAMEDCLFILERPKTNCLDNLTRIFLLITKKTVIGGRLNPIVIKDIQPEKILQKVGTNNLQCIYPFVGGIRFALSDEFYSNSLYDLRSNFGTLGRLALSVLERLDLVDCDVQFAEEFEGVVLLEGFMRLYLPDVPAPWLELSSDEANSDLAFYGLGQFFLEHRRAWEGRGSSKAPAGTEFVIDVGKYSQYACRANLARLGCVAFFGADQMPLAIFLPVQQMLVRPGDADWEHAKFALRCTLVSVVTAGPHLVWCHWIVSNGVSLASREELDRDHPVRRVLHLFTFRSAEINLISSETLMPEDRLLHRSAALEYPALAQCFEDSVKSWVYQSFPEMCASKQFPEGFTTPFVEDGLEVWTAFERFFSSYVEIYYPGPSAPEALGQELHDYWNNLEKSTTYGYGLPTLTKDALIEHLTHTAFWVCAMHEFVGNIVEYFEAPSFSATKLRHGSTMADVQTYFQNLCVVGFTGFRLPALVSDWSHLFLPDQHYHDCVRLQKCFMDELKAISDNIWIKNNSHRKRPFCHFDPRAFETSVSI